MFFYLILNAGEVAEGGRYGVYLAANTIIPALFPFLILSDFIIKSELLSPLEQLFGVLSRLLFKFDGGVFVIYILSLLGGYPVGAACLEGYLERHRMSQKNKKRALLFVTNGGFPYALSVVGAGLFGDLKIGVIILLSNISAGLFLGFCTARFFKAEFKNETKKPESSRKKQKAAEVFVSSVKNGSLNMLYICFFIILFSSFLMPLFKTVLEGVFSENNTAFFYSLFELGGGILNFTPSFAAIPLIAFITGFGGLCVLLQIMAVSEKSSPGLPVFLIYKTLSGLLSAAFCLLFIKLFNLSVLVSVMGKRLSHLPAFSEGFSYFVFLFVAIAAVFCGFLGKKDGNFDIDMLQ